MMDIEDYQVGLVGFAGAVTLNPLQRKMAEGCSRLLTLGKEPLMIDWGDYQKHEWNKMNISKITA